MKLLKLAALTAPLILLSGCSDDAASVSLGLFTTKDIKVVSQQDNSKGSRNIVKMELDCTYIEFSFYVSKRS